MNWSEILYEGPKGIDLANAIFVKHFFVKLMTCTIENNT